MRGSRFRGWVLACAAVAGCGGSATQAGAPQEGGASEGSVPPVDASGLLDGARPDDGSIALHLDSGACTSGSSGGGTTTATSGKVDILIDIDNSASMGDKQDFLKAAIPNLINGLINPNCVDPCTQAVLGVSTNGACAQGVLAFAPVHDMHVGIITSSLGTRGGDACNPQAMAPAPFSNVPAHNDDQAHLVDRTLTFTSSGASASESVTPDATSADPFLYWFPGGQDGGGAPAPGRPSPVRRSSSATSPSSSEERASSDAGSSRSWRAGTAF